MAGLAKLAFALVLTAAPFPQSRLTVPPPAELAERSEAVRELVAGASRAPDERVESAAARVNTAVVQVAEIYGEDSVEFVQAATEAGIALIRDWKRYDLALPHIERAQAASRAVFGNLHRETAYAVQDLAVVRYELRPELFIQWSKPLAQESVDIRRKVLGPGHLETAGSERFLADWIYRSWSSQRRRSARSPMLPEARGLAQHSLAVLEAEYGVTHHEVVGTRYLLAEIALAMEEYALAERLGMELVFRYDVPCGHADGGPRALDLVADALRGQSRAPEAERFDAAAAKCDPERD